MLIGPRGIGFLATADLWRKRPLPYYCPQTIEHLPKDQPYVVGVDGVGKIPGTAWLPALFTAPFQKGLQRLQRFVDLAWLTLMENGYSRAIPLLWLPAFTQKAFLRSTEAKRNGKSPMAPGSA